MSIQLAPDLEAEVLGLLGKNGCRTPDEVIRAALRRFGDAAAGVATDAEAARRAALIANWDSFVASVPPGNPNLDASREAIHGDEP